MVSDSRDGKHWGDNLTPELITGLVITTIMLGVGFFAIAWGFSEQTKRQWDSDERSGEYSAYTYGPAYDACLKLPTDSQKNCTAKANDERRKNEREEQDLVAQQTSALWAFLMGAAAIVGMVVSAIGVFLVWTTFNETRKSNNIAQDHQRARLLPSAELGATHHLSETKKVVLRCENIGLSPAYRARCFALPVTEIPKTPPSDLVWGYERTIIVGAKNDLVEVGNFETNFYIVGMIQYDTIFGGPKQSYFCFGFVWSQKSRKWFAVSQIPETWPRDT